MKNLITIIILLTYCYAQAQVPGYLGKRFSIEGNLNVLPRFTERLLNNYSRKTIEVKEYTSSSGGVYYEYNSKIKHIYKYRSISLNLKTILRFNYVLTRKIEASLNLTYLKNSLVLSPKYEELMFDTQKDKIPYRAFEYDLNFRFYRKNVIAPMGKYFILGMGISHISSREILEINYIANNSIYKTRAKKEKVTFLKYNLGYGSKRLLKNNIYFMYEAQMSFYKTRSLRKKRINTPADLDVLFKREVGRHISYDNFLNLNIGIGIIL